jgi:hypothetical protein
VLKKRILSNTLLRKIIESRVHIGITVVSASVAEPHQFYAAPAPAPGKNFDAAPAPAPTLLYSKAKFLK